MSQLSELVVTLTLADKFSKPIGNVGSQLKNLRKAFSGINGDIKRFDRQMIGYGKAMKAVGGQLLGEALTQMHVLSATASNLSGPIMESAAFEQQMARVFALRDLVGGGEFEEQQRKRLNELALQLGRDTTFTAMDAGKGFENFARAGFEVEAMLNALPSALRMAEVEMMSLDDATSIMSNVMGAFGLDKNSAAEAQRVADVLAKGSSLANTNILGIGEAMKYSADKAKQLGLPLEQVVAIFDAFADAGIDASSAGTALQNMLTKLADSSTRDELEKKGVKVTTDDGDLRDLQDIMLDIKRITDTMGKVEAADFLGDLFGVRGGRGAAPFLDAILSGKYNDNLNELLNAQGFASQKAKEVNDTVIGSLKTLESAWSDMKIAIGDVGKEDFRSVVEGLTGFIKQISGFVRENPRFINAVEKIVVALMGMKALAIAFRFSTGALLSVGGDLAKLFGTIIKPISTFSRYMHIAMLRGVGFWKALWGAVKYSTGLGKVLALLGNPLTVLIAGFLAFAGAVYYLYTRWDELTPEFKYTMTLFTGMLGALLTLQTGLKLFGKEKALGEWLVKLNGGFKDAAKAVFNFSRDLIKNTAAGVARFGRDIASAVRNLGKLAWNLAVNAANAVKEFAVSIATRAWEALKTFGTAIWNAIADLGKFIWHLAVKAVTAVSTFVTSLAVSAWNALTTFATTLTTTVIPAVWNFAAALLANPMTWIVVGIAGLVGALVWLSNNWDWVKESMVSGIQDLSLKFTNWWNSLKDWLSEKWEWFKSLFDLTGVFDGLYDMITAPFKSAFDTVSGWWNDLKNLFGFGATVNVNTTGTNLMGVPQRSEDGQQTPRGYAKGGFIDRPINALIGEAGPEWVIPEHGNQKRNMSLLYGAANALGVGIGPKLNGLVPLPVPVTAEPRPVDSGGVIASAMDEMRGSLFNGVNDRERPLSFSGPIYISIPETEDAEALIEKLARGLRQYADMHGEAAFA